MSSHASSHDAYAGCTASRKQSPVRSDTLHPVHGLRRNNMQALKLDISFAMTPASTDSGPIAAECLTCSPTSMSSAEFENSPTVGKEEVQMSQAARRAHPGEQLQGLLLKWKGQNRYGDHVRQKRGPPERKEERVRYYGRGV